MTSSRIRVIDLETAGIGPYDVCEIGWQDVVEGNDGLWSLSDERGALFEPPRKLRRLFGLSYAAMAGCSSAA